MNPRRWSFLEKVLVAAAVALPTCRPTASWAQQIIVGPGKQIVVGAGGRVQVLGAGRSQPEREPAQNVFQRPERITLQRLAKARQLLGEARYGEAVRYLGAILDGPEDYFFQPDREVPIDRSLKAEAQRLIGQMPRKGRELYELQYGARARQMLAEALSRGDRARLAEVSRRFFHTRAGYQATFLLGLQNLDHGEPLYGALTLQRLRRAPGSADQFEPTLSLAMATCWLQAGRPEKARDTLSALKQRGGDAVAIAGQQESLFGGESEASSWLVGRIGPQGAAAPAEPDGWTMFRGNPSRNAATGGSPPLLNMRWWIPATDRPLVESILGQLQRSYLEYGIPALPALHPLAVHKEFVIQRPDREPWRIQDVVLMRTARNLLAVDFRTGKRLWEVPVDDPLETIASRTTSTQSSRIRRSSGSAQLASALGYRMWEDATYGTLSSDGRYVFTIEDLRMGIAPSSSRAVFIGGRPRTSMRKAYNRLAAHDIRTGKLKWHVGGPSDEFALPLAETFFLGPPLPLMGQLYVLAEVKEEIRLLALDAGSGDLLWSQQLAIVDRGIPDDPVRRFAGASPSYTDGILVCPTAAGAVVAVDLATRSLLWGYRYERLQAPNRYAMIAFRVGRYPGSQPMQRWSDAGACVVGGRVLVTPVDSDSLHCLNLIDGERLWKYRRQDDLYVACVHRGKVVLVGRRGVRALSLAETVEKTETLEETVRTGTSVKTVKNEVTVVRPKPAWDGRIVELPEGAMPSGRGFFSGDRYFVPLSSAEVAAIDLVAGKLVHVSKSRKGGIPGNLICHNGKVLSQGFDGLKAFYQLGTVREEIDRRLAAQPDDPEALSLRGEVLLDEGKLPEAIACFRRAYQLDTAPRTRNLLRDALLDALRLQFAAHRDRAEEIEQLLDIPEQRATYLRLMAVGLQRAGQWRAALDHYGKLIDLDQEHRGMEVVTSALSVRRDRWIQAQLASLRSEGVDEASAVDGVVEARLQAAIAAPGEAPLRQFLDYFGNHPAAAKARHELFGRLKDSGQLLGAELLLGQQQSSDPAAAGAAVAELAEMFRHGERPEDAALCYGRLGRRFADVVCRDGKTGKELLEALPQDGAVRQMLRRDAGWRRGKVEVNEDASRRATSSTQARYALKYEGDPAPFLSETTIRFDQSRRQIQGRDALGKVQWHASLVEPGSSSTLQYYSSQSYGRARGHLLLLAAGQKIAAVDTLGSPGADTRKLLWTRNLNDPSFDAVTLRQLHLGMGNVMWGGFGVTPYYGSRPSGLGPVTSRYVCFQRYRNLMVADPLSGDLLWVRGGIASGSTIFGDDQFIFTVAPDQDEAMVFRALDGELLGKRKVPRTKTNVASPDGTFRAVLAPFQGSCIATLGRQLLVWRLDGAQYVLELFDPWQQKRVWSRPFALDASKCLVGHEAIGVFQRDGHFVLLGLPDGRTIVDAKLEAESSVSEIVVLRLSDQYVLVTSAARTQPNLTVMPQPLPGTLYKVIYSGRVYSFDLEGRPMWPGPVKIDNQHVLLNQPSRLPVVTFACGIYDRKQSSSKRRRVKVLLLDKRTGRKVYENEFDNMTSAFELAGDPEKNTVELRLTQKGVALTFTDDPIPPPPEKEEEPGGQPSQPPKAAGALLKAIEAALGGLAEKAAESPEKAEAEPAAEK